MSFFINPTVKRTIVAFSFNIQFITFSLFNLLFLILFHKTFQQFLRLGFTSTVFILIVLWYVLLYLLTISSNLSIYTFLILKSCIYKFCFLRFFLINLSAAKDFLSLCIECNSIAFFSNHDFIDLL